MSRKLGTSTIHKACQSSSHHVSLKVCGPLLDVFFNTWGPANKILILFLSSSCSFSPRRSLLHLWEKWRRQHPSSALTGVAHRKSPVETQWETSTVGHRSQDHSSPNCAMTHLFWLEAQANKIFYLLNPIKSRVKKVRFWVQGPPVKFALLTLSHTQKVCEQAPFAQQIDQVT